MLNKTLEQYELTAIGIGSVIGCGIFFLFRNIMKRAGPLTALAFLIAAIPNIIAALSYAELSGMYDSNAVEYDCLKDAFNEKVATASIYFLILFIIFNASTIILFCSHILKLDQLKYYFCILVLLILSVINYLGIDLSKNITNTVVIIEFVILFAVILFGMIYWKYDNTFIFIDGTMSVQSFWIAAFLAIFLYTGYDTVVKMTEETKDSKKNVPRAMIWTITIVTVIYLLIAFTAICLPNYKSISNSLTPISKMFEIILGSGSYLKVIYIISVFIVINAFFISVISLSRLLYGLSKEDKLPKKLSEVNEVYHTPHNAIIITFILIALALLIDNPEWAATFANIFFLIFLLMIFLAVIILRIKQPDRERSFIIPFNVFNIPILVVFGIIISLGFIIFVGCSTKHIGINI